MALRRFGSVWFRTLAVRVLLHIRRMMVGGLGFRNNWDLGGLGSGLAGSKGFQIGVEVLGGYIITVSMSVSIFFSI